ncbi:ribonuclease H-like domain-containing protein [Xylariales sp. PMI_506]|nr:ribonuclease H-like domain-containing protein [Xylariales sp. PMI_506]
MESSQDFKSMQDKIQSALVRTTRTSNQLAAEDLGFQRSSNPTVDEQLDEASERLLSLSTSLLQSVTRGTNLKAPELEDTDDVEANWSKIVDVIDTLLEKADTCLDEYTGLVKRKAAPTTTTDSGSLPKKSKTFDSLDPSLRRANILKPQNAFQVKPDNLSPGPWKPILTSKPHALRSLQESLETFENEDGQTQYKHPYETEIHDLKYPSSMYQVEDPIKYQPVETTVATFVNTYEGVVDMLAELKKAKVIAIDTEHHDFRTYSGLLSLMQISTRDRDWIVDTLQPWRHKLEVLNEVFADPSIVKVLHGAYMDIIWLQRDCGLYIVGLFDTFHAADSLGYSARSLAYLLKRFIDFDADKKYQLADWRIRPIPDDMFYYARSDTHYLLYIYDMIRNELNERSKSGESEDNYMDFVLERSKETSLRRYEKFVYDGETGQGAFGWFNILMKQSSGNFTREQFAVFRAVHKWRDDVARREDESPAFIMSNAAVFDIARRLPPDPKALHSLIPPSSYAAKKAAAELFKVVTKAKAESVNGPTLSEFFSQSSASSNRGVGAVVQRIASELKIKDQEPILETKELVANSSQLWGQVPISSRWEPASDERNSTHTMQFALPWSSFVEQASVNESAAPVVAASSPQAQAQQKKSGTAADDYANEFTLKAGMKRKAPEPEVEDPIAEAATISTSKPSGLKDDEISVIDSEEEEERARARRKAEKKERKALQKAKLQAERQAGTANNESENEEDDQPFDYSQAKSVLNAKRDATSDAARGARGKVFNPYSSLTAEGPKAARRMHGEKIGKSGTFKKL